MRTCLLLTVLLATAVFSAPAQDLGARIDARVAEIEEDVVAWRRDIHAHPELGNREFRTAEKVAEHLRSLGMAVRTEVGHTGVVGVLRGGRPGPAMASSDGLRIVVRGKQTHGARPWGGVDPIVTASQIVLGLQTIASRQVNVTKAPSIITVGSIHGGVRGNIIPDEVELVGTVRAFDTEMQQDIHRRIKETAEHIAAAAGAEAEVRIGLGYPVTVNDPALYEQMVPTLRRVAGAENVVEAELTTGAEDFSYFAQRAPGLYFFLGTAPEGADLEGLPLNHSPLFFVDEGVLPLGVRALAHLTVDYMQQ